LQSKNDLELTAREFADFREFSAHETARLPQIGRRLSEQGAKGATGHASQFSVGATGEYDRDLGSNHNSGSQCSGQVLKLLKEDVSGFKIRNHQKIRISCDRGLDLLDPRSLARYGIIECERTVDDGSGIRPCMEVRSFMEKPSILVSAVFQVVSECTKCCIRPPPSHGEKPMEDFLVGLVEEEQRTLVFAALSRNHPTAGLVERSGMAEGDPCCKARRKGLKDDEKLFENRNENTATESHGSFRGIRVCSRGLSQSMASPFDTSLHAVSCFLSGVSGCFRGLLDARLGIVRYIFRRLGGYVACVLCRFVDGGCDVLGKSRGGDGKDRRECYGYVRPHCAVLLCLFQFKMLEISN
jgi:hypothetical protein